MLIKRKQKNIEISLAKIIIYIIIAFLLVALLLIAIFPEKIQWEFNSVKSGEEKCKPDLGYTEQEWKEHISHHPDIYKECLS